MKDRRPRVLVIGPVPPPYGGVATFTQMVLSSRLQELFRLALFNTSWGSPQRGTWAELRVENVVRTLFQAFHLTLTMLAKRPSIVHVPITSRWSFWKAVTFMFIGKTLSGKVVGHLHGGMFDQFYRGSSPRSRGLIRWGLEQADVLIVLSEYWRQFVEAEIEPSTCLVVLPNAVDHHQIDCLQAPLLNGENRYACRTVIMVAGGLSRRKGIDELARAIPMVVKDIPDARFNLVGQWVTPEDEQSFIEECQQLGVASHVTLAGAVTYEEAIKCLAKASVFVLPSHVENLPFAVIEAMASGLPVVTTPVGALPEMIEDGVTGFLVPVHDHYALADRLVQLLSSPELSRNMGRSARARFEERYSQDVVIQKLADLYTALAT